MEHENVARSQERARVMAEVAGVPIAEERIAALAEAFDGARLMIAQLEPLADRVDVPAGAPYNPAWDGAGEQR